VSGRSQRPVGRGRTTDRRPGRPADTSRAEPAGRLARHLALMITEAVVRDRLSLDRALPHLLSNERFARLDPRDKAFARLLAMTVLRRHADLDRLVGQFLEKPLPEDATRIRLILLAGAAELTLLAVAPHAALSNAVELTRLSPKTSHFDRLANAILRRISEKGDERLAETADITSNFPSWMIEGWREAYGPEMTGRIATASIAEAALDLAVKVPARTEALAEQLGAVVLDTGTLRRPAGGRIEDLPGYSEGEWWVQDAAASLPARLLGTAPGETVLDLCAAPGGKTAQLAASGAEVTAVDVSFDRLARLAQNLTRLGLEAHAIPADATTWRGGTAFDRILLDAPCSSTGTIRRHPDILHLKRAEDIHALTDIQERLLRNAASQLRVGGTLVYCTCSLEPAEGEARIAAFLANPGSARLTFRRQPITPEEVGGHSDWITPAGDLRTFPFHLPAEDPRLAGIDGFFAARLVRTT